MKVMGMTAEGATIATLDPIEVKLMTALVEVALDFVKGSGSHMTMLTVPPEMRTPEPAPKVKRIFKFAPPTKYGPRKVKRADSNSRAGETAVRMGKDGEVPLWKLAADLLEKEQRPMSPQEIAEKLNRERKEVTDRMWSRRDMFQKVSYGTWAAKSWKPRELNREEKLLVEAEPEQLLPEAKAKRLELLKMLGKKGE